MTERKRNYKREYANESAKRRKDRALRNKARRQLMREGKVRKGDGRVAHHKKPLSRGGSSSRSNITVQSASKSNREGGRVKNGRRKT